MMNRVQRNGLVLWEFSQLTLEPGIRHFVTERNSNPGGEEFTLSFSSDPDKEKIRQHRRLLAHALGVGETKLFFPSQVHKTRVVTVTENTTKEELAETDALITDKKNICIAVMSADCVPVLLYDRKNGVVAAIHAGWRGTVAKIVEKTLSEMRDLFGTKGEDIVAAIGPSVCQESYEVGEEVIREVDKAFGRSNSLMKHKPGNKAHLDLWQANKLQLVQAGVDEKNIEVSGRCSVLENQHFFSARKGDAGRFAAGIMMI
jgi:polyphenol oxidase